MDFRASLVLLAGLGLAMAGTMSNPALAQQVAPAQGGLQTPQNGCATLACLRYPNDGLATQLMRHPNFDALYGHAVTAERLRDGGIMPRGGPVRREQFARELAERPTALRDLAYAHLPRTYPRPYSGQPPYGVPAIPPAHPLAAMAWELHRR